MATAPSTERGPRFGLVLAAAFASIWAIAASDAQTPAEQQLDRARRAIESGSDDRRARADLAIGWTRRARETSRTDFYDRALTSIAHARSLSTGGPRDVSDSELDLIEAWVRLGRHEFERAGALAKRATEERPLDPRAWGIWGDASMELGRYQDSMKAYARLGALEPGPSAYLRIAHYRETIGDFAGALELLNDALAATPRTETEQRAWTLVQMANVDLAAGRIESANERHLRALEAFPEYHYALAGLARVALARGDGRRAAAFARAAYEAAPHPENRLLLASALRGSGRTSEARRHEAAFVREALARVDQPDNENPWLIDFFLDHDPSAERALELARREARRRSDVGTLVRLARALEHAGRNGDARLVMERLLGVVAAPDRTVRDLARRVGALHEGLDD